MKFETKALLIFSLIIIIGFIIINSISFLYYKNTLELSILREANAYLKLHQFNDLEPIPDYFKIVKKGDSLPSLELIPLLKDGDLTIYVDENYIKEKYLKFYINLLLWDSVIIIGLFVFFHYTILRYIKKEAQLRKTLELSILSISHKLGNFLSINKLNLEILKESCPQKELDRLLYSYNLIEKDFKHLTSLLKQLDKEPTKNLINIKTLIERTINEFSYLTENKKVILHLKDFYIRTDENKIDTVIYNIIENALKFSKSYIHIKMCIKKNKLVLAIRNDISFPTNSNTGIGLNIVRQLLPELSGKLYYRAKKNHYITVIVLYK
ncbi:MAG: HAMP domain-containing histidine kinase [Aquificae bacterium]|nr:HAMP domain-containing histidine kinase [Aquificota bacterium]